MNPPARERVTASASGVEVRKSLDTAQFQHPVVFLRLRSGRDEPVEVRVTDPLPESISIDDVALFRNTATGVWRREPGRVTFECTLEPGAELTTTYSVTDAELGDRPFTEPAVDFQVSRGMSGRILSRLRTGAIYLAAGLGLNLVYVVLVPVLLIPASPAFLLGSLLLGLVTAAGLWKTFVKVGQPGWKAIVPLYNVFVLLRITGHPWWWVLGLIFPVVGQSIWAKLAVDLSRGFGRGSRFGFGLAFFPFVCLPHLGFGDDDYLGRDPRTDPDRIITAVEWMGNLEHPDIAATTVETLRTRSPTSLTAHRLRYAIEAVEAYREVGAADIDLDDAHESLVSIWERKTGADWETVAAA